MHFFIGLGILAGLVWFTFGAGVARTLVGAALVGVVAVFGLLAVVAAIDIHRQSVEQAEWENGGREAKRNECAKWAPQYPSRDVPRDCIVFVDDLRREQAEAKEKAERAQRAEEYAAASAAHDAREAAWAADYKLRADASAAWTADIKAEAADEAAGRPVLEHMSRTRKVCAAWQQSPGNAPMECKGLIK